MKKASFLLATLLMTTSLMTGCSGAPSSIAVTPSSNTVAPTASAVSGSSTAMAPTELVVFAAASMTETLNRIATLYKEVAPQVKLVYNFDSSGTLKTQIQEGADCDIFISAAQKQMNQLDLAADPSLNTEKLDLVLSNTRFNLVSNSVVLVTPKGNPAKIKSFEDVNSKAVSLIALGNSDVPVGQYAEEIFKSMGVWDALNSAAKITFGTNVKEVLAQVEAASVDCGVVYSTDAATASGVEVVCMAPKDSHKPITYPSAILKNSKNQQAAQDFLTFLKTDAASAVFESVGFVVPKK
ncbi:MAG: molybdate ABC transporter substrate-binding protein [Oscillospiraceae bacterium]